MGDTDCKASTQQGKTINIDNTMAGQALGGYPSLLITDELAGIPGEGTKSLLLFFQFSF